MKLKIVVGVTLFLYVVFYSSVLTLSYIVSEVRKDLVAQQVGTQGIDSSTKETTANSRTSTVLSASEVAKHSTPSDCWIIISSRVYNVTTYLSAHPGGSQAIQTFCGKDATNGFATKNESPGEAHSSFATKLLLNFYLGEIGAVVPEVTPSPEEPSPSPIASAIVSSQSPVPVATSVSSSVLTVADVAQHKYSNDCWVIISDTVYNVTNYLSLHPGGVSAISKYCGADATSGFSTKDRSPGESHSSYARGLLANYSIGKIGSPVSQTAVAVATAVPALTNTTPASTSAPTQSTPTTVLSQSEVSTHSSSSNCWVIINGNVYNLTNYLGMHPGGTTAISQYCGKDGSTGFNTRGGKGTHSNSAKNLLSNYLLGSLNSTTTTSAGSGSTSPTSAPASQSGAPAGVPTSVSTKYPGATYGKIDEEDDGRLEFKLYYNGSCRSIKTNSSGTITSDKSC